MMALYALPGHGAAVPSEIILPFMIGLVVGWAMLNTVPSVLFGAPAELPRHFTVAVCVQHERYWYRHSSFFTADVNTRWLFQGLEKGMDSFSKPWETGSNHGYYLVSGPAWGGISISLNQSLLKADRHIPFNVCWLECRLFAEVWH